jgi:hypothetical protein
MNSTLRRDDSCQMGYQCPMSSAVLVNAVRGRDYLEMTRFSCNSGITFSANLFI